MIKTPCGKNSSSKHMVCHIIRHAKIAGTERHVMLLASHLDRVQFRIHVCTFENGDLVKHLIDRGVSTTAIPGNPSLIHLVKLVDFLRKLKPDVIHSHSGGYGCLAARLAGCKHIVYTKHGIGFTKELLEERSLFRKLRDFMVDRAVTAYVALTEHDREVMSRVLNIRRDKIRVIYNGIDPSHIEALSMKATTKPVIGTVGRLTEQKGIPYLIRAIPLIKEKIGDLDVHIVGDGEDELMLRTLAVDHKVADCVNFLGYVHNAFEIINNLDVFVLPSIWEGFPYVLLEAMFLKKPIVATNIFGIKEIIENNKTGILVKPRDHSDIANAVIGLLQDKVRALRLGRSAYQKACKLYTLEKTVSKTEALYTALLRS